VSTPAWQARRPVDYDRIATCSGMIVTFGQLRSFRGPLYGLAPPAHAMSAVDLAGRFGVGDLAKRHALPPLHKSGALPLSANFPPRRWTSRVVYSPSGCTGYAAPAHRRRLVALDSPRTRSAYRPGDRAIRPRGYDSVDRLAALV